MSKKGEFDEFKLSNEIRNTIKDLGFRQTTPVQSQVIPLALENKDLIVKSQTGSGKTAAYGIPICELIDWMKNKPQALILTPTRELAVQVQEDLTNIGRYKRIKVISLYGGQSFEIQRTQLKQKTHIIVGTPGRTLDHLKKGTLSLKSISHLVIDEADEMLNMGFIDQVESIIKRLSSKRVTMLYSATMPDEIKILAKKYMNSPINIDISENNADSSIPENIKHIQYKTEAIDKLSLLLDLTKVENPNSAIIFCNTKDQVDLVYDTFKEEKYNCGKIHGGMEQKDRLIAINNFKRGKFLYLIATDLLSRGIDVEDVPLIINFDIPPRKETYIHRTGRTARAGLCGKAISLVTPYDERYMEIIKKHLDIEIPVIQSPKESEVLLSKNDFQAKMKEKILVKNKKGLELEKNITKLSFNIGKKKGIRATTFVGIISNIEGVEAEDIGIVTVMDTMSFVEILNGKGDIVLKAMRKVKVKGKLLKIKEIPLDY